MGAKAAVSSMTLPASAHIRASLRLQPTEEGGRKRPIRTGYRPNCMIFSADGSRDEEYRDAVVHLESGDSLGPGESTTVRLQPALPDGWSAVAPGTRIDLCEGDRVIGTATVTELWPEGQGD